MYLPTVSIYNLVGSALGCVQKDSQVTNQQFESGVR